MGDLAHVTSHSCRRQKNNGGLRRVRLGRNCALEPRVEGTYRVAFTEVPTWHWHNVGTLVARVPELIDR